MKIIEIGTGYTSIPARMGAATEIVVEELSRAMLRQGLDVTILDIRDRNRMKTDLPIKEVYMPQILSTGAVVKLGIVHKLKRVLYSVSLAYKLKKVIKRCDEHLYLHFHNQYNLFFFLKLNSRKLREKVTIGYTVHSYIWFGKWENIKDTINRRYFQEVYCCQHADCVFVLNDIISDMLVDHYDVNPRVIYKVINGVNTDVYCENNVDLDRLVALKSRYGLDGKKVLFQVGSVCDRKNQLGTLELLLPLMKKDNRIVFAYAGGIIDDVYAQSIVDMAKESGVEDRVIYYGEVLPGKELNHLYTLADACVMNSKSESFALVVAESLSVPRPVFINESILKSLSFWGDNIGKGILKINNNFEKQLMRLLNDSDYADELKDKGRHFIEKEYSWGVAAIQYANSFNSRC
jgi:glycosyltransferase involved in cell wall biosynthesis